MDEEIITFGDIFKLKKLFFRYKSPIFSKGVNTDNILASNKIFPYREKYKYFIGYLYDDYNIKLL